MRFPDEDAALRGWTKLLMKANIDRKCTRMFLALVLSVNDADHRDRRPQYFRLAISQHPLWVTDNATNRLDRVAFRVVFGPAISARKTEARKAGGDFRGLRRIKVGHGQKRRSDAAIVRSITFLVSCRI